MINFLTQVSNISSARSFRSVGLTAQKKNIRCSIENISLYFTKVIKYDINLFFTACVQL